jgi:hypothetical protein
MLDPYDIQAESSNLVSPQYRWITGQPFDSNREGAARYIGLRKAMQGSPHLQYLIISRLHEAKSERRVP